MTAQAATLHIINGTIATAHSHPWMVSVIIQREDSTYVCGGSLIKPKCKDDESNLVLTSAHCLDCSGKFVTKIQAGELNVDETEAGEEQRTVTQVACHPDKNNIDMGIVKLDKPIKFSKTIRPLNVPDSNRKVPEGTKCAFAGWGQTEKGSTSILREIVNITPKPCCKEVNFFNDHFFCAKRISSESSIPEHLGSAGDSGSPFVCQYGDQYVAEGVFMTNWYHTGIKQCNDLRSLYVRVSPWYQWIEEQVKSFGVCVD